MSKFVRIVILYRIEKRLNSYDEILYGSSLSLGLTRTFISKNGNLQISVAFWLEK